LTCVKPAMLQSDRSSTKEIVGEPSFLTFSLLEEPDERCAVAGGLQGQPASTVSDHITGLDVEPICEASSAEDRAMRLPTVRHAMRQVRRRSRARAGEWSVRVPPSGDRVFQAKLTTKGSSFMKARSMLLGIAAVLAASGASAQSISLTGIYRCVQMCRGNLPAQITQNGHELNLVNEAGVPSRAWPDAFWPANRIWVDAYDESAVYSPDGMLIQFDNGTIWHRDLGPVRPRLRP
jgi:hypothetical protein